EQNQARQREPAAIGESALAPEVFDGLAAIIENLYGVGNAGLLKRHLEEEHIVTVILNKQDCVLPSGHTATRCNCNQNLLPWPGTDSTPTRPPMRSTAFWTMARPMPVPSYFSAGCARWNMPKMRRWSSGAIPMPLSSKQTRTSCLSRRLEIRTRGVSPRRVNLTAFERRFETHWLRKISCPKTGKSGFWTSIRAWGGCSAG